MIKGNKSALLGLNKIRLNWSEIEQVRKPYMYQLLDKYNEVFSEELGTMKGQKATIAINPDATPHYHKARTVPYAY